MNKHRPGKDPRIDWPYATSYLLETLDPELIEAHTERILSRALNIGRTVGFIGAGVAMSYGRISWQTLVQTELKRVTAKMEKAKLHPNWKSSKADDAKRLWETLDTLKLSRTDIRSERYPMLFQVSEQLDKALNKFLGTPDEVGLRAHAARLTIDDVGHAYQILFDSLCHDQPSVGTGELRRQVNEDAAYEFIETVLDGRFEPDLLHRVYSGVADEKVNPSKKPIDGSAYRLFFETKSLQRLLTILKESAQDVTHPLHGLVNRLAEVVSAASESRPAHREQEKESVQNLSYLLPTDRYLVGVLLHLAPTVLAKQGDPKCLTTWQLPAPRWWAEIAEKVDKFRQEHDPKRGYATKPVPKVAATTRHGLVTQWRDPLLYMQERLRISRFITTNFDGEIERLFRDQSFREPALSGDQKSLMRPQFQAIVFDNAHSGDLTAFAVKERSLSGAVVHLHGRAETDVKEADSRIVVTETDYQKRYLRPDPSRKLVDDAIRLAFGSSPILFVGSNMGEDDLLRPLRQFMSGPARVGDRVAIALVPAMTDRSRRTEDKIALLGRYGVYAIHFGNCRFKKIGETFDPVTPNLNDQSDMEWLAWYWALQKSAREILKFLSAEKIGQDSLSSEYEAADQARARLRKIYDVELELTPNALDKISDSLVESMPDEERLAALDAKIAAQRNAVRTPLSDTAVLQVFELQEPVEIEGVIVRESKTVEIAVEVKLLNCILNWISEVFPSLEALSPPKAPKTPDKSWTFGQARTAKALLLALEGAGDSVLAILTCARLEKAKHDWDNWKTNWFTLPVPDKVDEPLPAPSALTKRDGKNRNLVSEHALVTLRHQIGMPPRPGHDPREGRFYRGAPSQSTQGLIDSLESRAAQAFRDARGRRFLLLAAYRGLGKGYFFSSLEDCYGCPDNESLEDNEPRVLEFLRALNPIRAFNQDVELDSQDEYIRSQWIGLAFIGLSFSQEVMSAFDRVIDLLYKCLKLVDNDIADSLKFEELENDRIESLRAVLTGWARHGADHPKDTNRVLIAFSGFGVFYDSDGLEKNGQVKRLCDLIFSDAFAAAPIDFVFICLNDRLPAALVGPEASQSLIPLLPEGRDAKDRARAERVLQAAGIGPRGTRPLARPGLKMYWLNSPQSDASDNWQTLQVRAPKASKGGKVDLRSPAVAIHVLKEARAVVIAATYFPRVAIFVARKFMWDAIRNLEGRDGKRRTRPVAIAAKSSPKSSGDADRIYSKDVLPTPEEYGGVFETHARDSRDQMRLSINILHANTPRVLPKDFAPAVMLLLAMVQEFSETQGEDPAADLIAAYREEIRTVAQQKSAEGAGDSPCIAAALKMLRDRVKSKTGTDETKFVPAADYLYDLFPKIVNDLDDFMRDLFSLVDGGRFLLTLIFSGAYEATARLTEDGTTAGGNPAGSGKPRQKMQDVEDVATGMMKVLDNLRLSLKGVPATARASVVIEEVLSTMRRRSDRNSALPIPLRWSEGRKSDEYPEHGDIVWPAMKPLLHKLMMEVIWHLSIIGQPVEPVVLECCPRILAACKPITDQKWGDKEISPMTCIREVLALATNRCLIFRLVANLANLAKSVPEGGKDPDPDDESVRYTVHRLVQTHVFRSLGASASEFPDADQFTLSLFASQPDDLPRLSAEAHKEISKVIAALSNYPREPEVGGTADPDVPDFEPMSSADRRRRLRATLGIMRSIYSVAVLSRFDRRTDTKGEELLQEGFFEEHRRRIRWLLKVGVELTQEDKEQSPFYKEEIVWLCNECAVLSMVEGRLADAQGLFTLALDAAKRIEPDDSGPLHVRLLLNRAICDIERGHSQDARRALERIAVMTDEHPVPPLLAKGYLGLIDHLAGEIAQAELSYKTAIAGLAKLGRSRSASIFSRHYGDMLGGLRQPREEEGLQLIENAIHFAQEGGHEDIRYLALVSLARFHIRKPGEIDGASIHKELDAIEAYGRVLGLPRILCEVALTRARLLLRQGETERAGTLVNESLEISSMNDMRLRKVSGMLLLAEINLRRNQRQAAKPLLALGIQMAKAINSHFSLTHGQSLERQLDAEWDISQ